MDLMRIFNHGWMRFGEGVLYDGDNDLLKRKEKPFVIGRW